ncbi:hypothetical protein K8P10_000332 [Leucobacter sp. Psy1]|uniref:hypothetical protein n=1 Tax=Leucobacter sp. Psy1 TaxID=2875729 RepID=UPI001CD345E4|nr:hypothetical protein [Leucobacter sp. Psy1]UBH04821.1 hypothetical protein K8P10_000332 [Leucobacter sp. Psy1]
MNSLTGSIDTLAGVSTFITLVVGVLSIFVFYFRGKKAVKQHVSKQVGELSLQISMGDQVLGERIASTEKVLETATQDLGGRIDTVERNLNTKIDTVEHNLNTKIDTVEHNLNTKIDTVEHNLNTKIDTVEHNLNTKIDTVEHNLNTKIDTVEHNLRDKIATETTALGDRIDHMNQHLQILDHRVFALGTRWGAWSEGPDANRKPQQTIPERRQTDS